MSNEALIEKLDQILNRVKHLEKFTDRKLTKTQLAIEWGVSDETITNYIKYHGLPVLKNGRIAWSVATDWLYDSKISNTKEGKKALKAISKQ